MHRNLSRRWKVLLPITAFVLAVTGSSAIADPPTEAESDLARDIDAILEDARLAGSQIGVVIRDADSDEVLYARHADRRLMPASNNKLFTAAAALEVLGPDHRFTTTVRSDGRRSGSKLVGDLYLVGGGDPTTLASDYDALAKQLADAGIRTVTGKLIADDSYFDSVRLGTEWANDDEPYYYAAQISALTVAPDTDYDAGTVIVQVTGGDAAGDPATVSLIPETGYVRIDNRVVTGSTTSVSVVRQHGSNTIVVSGTVAPGASSQQWASVWEPTGYAADVFHRALKRHGIKVRGKVAYGVAPEDAETLASHESMPLEEMLIPFLKLSNNGHAEVLIKTMGAEVYGRGTWSDGIRAANQALSELGVVTSTMRMVDGSGLSRQDLTTPGHVAGLLAAVQDEPWFDAWYQALPVAGDSDRMVGGTLRSRMRGTPAEGNVRAKTGSLTSVTALSGYVTSADGERLVFSIVFNNFISAKPSDLEDRIAIRLAQFSRSGTVDEKRSYRIVPPQHPDPRLGYLECSWVKAC